MGISVDKRTEETDMKAIEEYKSKLDRRSKIKTILEKLELAAITRTTLSLTPEETDTLFCIVEGYIDISGWGKW